MENLTHQPSIQTFNEKFVMSTPTIDEVTPMSKTQYLNYLAIDVLEKMGNFAPTQAEIDYVEALLTNVYRRQCDNN